MRTLGFVGGRGGRVTVRGLVLIIFLIVWSFSWEFSEDSFLLVNFKFVKCLEFLGGGCYRNVNKLCST